MKIEVFKRTQDNWYGNFKVRDDRRVESLVMVSFHGNICSYNSKLDPIWRTSVWGNDDTGMEIDCATEAEAREKFQQVIEMEYVDRAPLLKLGFVGA